MNILTKLGAIILSVGLIGDLLTKAAPGSLVAATDKPKAGKSTAEDPPEKPAQEEKPGLEEEGTDPPTEQE